MITHSLALASRIVTGSDVSRSSAARNGQRLEVEGGPLHLLPVLSVRRRGVHRLARCYNFAWG